MSQRTGNLTEENALKLELDTLVAECRTGALKGKPLDKILKTKDIERLQTRYGKFIETRDSDQFLTFDTHEIHRPNSPRPYFHALNNFALSGAAYGTLWDQTGHGFSYHRTVRGGEITANTGSPYKPNEKIRSDKRSFFLREKNAAGLYATPENDKINAWPVFPFADSRLCQYSDFSCRQTPLSIEIRAAKHDIECGLTLFVPDHRSCELWKFTLANRASKKRDLDLFVELPWGLDAFPVTRLDRGNLFDVDLPAGANTVILRNVDAVDRNPRTAFLASGEPFAGFELSRSAFEGCNSCDIIPGGVLTGRLSSRKTVPLGVSPITALHFKVTLPASGAKTLFFALGAETGGRDDAKKSAAALRREAFSEKSFTGLQKKKQESWDAFAGRFQIRTPDPEFDRHFNVWTLSQLTHAALFHNGAPKIEFRDKLQALSALTPYAPEIVRRELKTAVGFQLRDGRAISLLSNIREACSDEEVTMDNTLWMVEAVCRYLAETGDLAFLDENIGFFDPKVQALDNSRPAKLYDHIMAAVRCLFDYRGRFGLCKVGSRDRNKALTQITKLGGISAWLSMMLIRCAKEMFPYARLRNVKRDVGTLNTILENMYSNLNNYSWNGSHYTYAYDDNGNPIGNRGDKEGAVHLTANSWALLCGAAAQGGHEEAVHKLIATLDTPFGHRNVAPSYPLGFKGKGGIPDLLPGVFENGSIDLHNRAFLLLAFADKGRGRDAFETVKKALPSRTLPDISTANPAQLSEFTVGPDHPDFGRNMFDIFTPAVASFRLGLERMMGVIPQFEGLWLSPAVPPHWNEVEIRKRYRDHLLSIKIHNPQGQESGIKKVTVNGKELAKSEDGRFVLTPESLKGLPKNKAVCVDALL